MAFLLAGWAVFSLCINVTKKSLNKIKDRELRLVFQALGSDDRRQILDQLYMSPGSLVGTICDQFATSRFAVMKHLRILEEANLISTLKRGRHKHLYLNPVPLRMVYDRWIAPHTSHIAGHLTGMKFLLEQTMDNSEQVLPDEVFVIYIRSTVERVWQALTNPEQTRLFYLGADVRSSFVKGEPIEYLFPAEDGSLEVGVEGIVLEVDPPHRLVHSFYPIKVDPDRKESNTTVTYEIEAQQDQVCVRVVHGGFYSDSELLDHTRQGWPRILSDMKSILEQEKNT